MIVVHHEKVQEGCFVYQVVRGDRTRITSIPEIDESSMKIHGEGHFMTNELLAVDLIQPTSHATFLRLADQGGWVVAEAYGDIYLRQIPVERNGLYTFYVDHFPRGLVVRRHPMDDTSDFLASEAEGCMRLEPMQKIYCDAMTTHPVTGVKFYRIQACQGRDDAPATPGWVYDRVVGGRTDKSDRMALLPVHMVSEGMFVYRALHGVATRIRPDCTEDSKTNCPISKGDIVVADLIRKSPYSKGNGPFLRLMDGSGWVFEKKQDTRVFEKLPYSIGKWIVSVLNDPVGLKSRRQPTTAQHKMYDDVYKFGTVVECDRRISDGKVHYYRVEGTTGWLFDARDGLPMLRMLQEDLKPKAPPLEKLQPWSPDFVRGVASTISGCRESMHDKHLDSLTFENSSGVTIKVFCSTRTVGCVAANMYHFERNCSTRYLNSCFGQTEMSLSSSVEKEHNTEANTVAAKDECKNSAASEKQKGESLEEEKLRQELLTCDAELAAIQAKRRDLMYSLRAYDKKRTDEIARMKQETDAYMNKHGGLAIQPDSPIKARLHGKHSELKGIVNSPSSKGSLSSSRSSEVYSFDKKQAVEEIRQTGASSPLLERKPVPSSKTDTSSSNSKIVCGECFRQFSGKYSRDLHCREVHQLYCTTCDKIFPSSNDLAAHKEKAKHT